MDIRGTHLPWMNPVNLIDSSSISKSGGTNSLEHYVLVLTERVDRNNAIIIVSTSTDIDNIGYVHEACRH